MSKKQPTLNDVAALAGVSYQTVSRVINNSTAVSKRTKEVVASAMLSLNYVPNRVAQQLAGKKSNIIGLATTDIALHAPSQIASSIKKKAEKLGYNVILAMRNNQSSGNIEHVINELLAQRVDGLIVNIPSDHEQVIKIQTLCQNIPVLFMDVDPLDPCFSIMTDSREGGRKAILHLTELGHTSIALVTGPETSISAQLRFEGWVNSLQEYHRHPVITLEGDWSSDSGYSLVKMLCVKPNRPTAICFANDQMALGGMRALHEYGIKIPEEMSVIGYDDTEDSAFFFPPLTTIAQDFKNLGEQAVNKLIQKINAPNDNIQSLVLPANLVNRETTAPYTPSAEYPKHKEIAKQLHVFADYLSNNS